MSLSFPSRIGEQLPASPEAPENLTKLLRADLRGRKDQVATRVALQYFQRMQDLRPGYFEGVKSWVKGGCVYALGGTVSAAAIGLSGWGLYLLGQKAYESGYGVHIVGALAAGGIISKELGFNPIGGLAAFLGVAVRDSADRAAKWSVKQDEKFLDAKQLEAKECRKEIYNQLMAVYNDCAKGLSEQVGQAEINESTDDRFQLRRMADAFEKRLPAIEQLLAQFELGQHEVESILQRLKERIRFVQANACKLDPKKSFEKLNAELLAKWSSDSIGQIAVPIAIKERIEAANQSRIGIFGKVREHLHTAVSGVTTLAASTAAVAAITFSIAAYQNGTSATFTRVQDFISGSNRTIPDDNRGAMLAMGGAAALSIVGPTAAVVAKKTSANQRAFISNAEYVEGELSACKKDLKAIYNGVKNHLATLSYSDRSDMIAALRVRLPAIREEIENLGLVENPNEILGTLEQAIR